MIFHEVCICLRPVTSHRPSIAPPGLHSRSPALGSVRASTLWAVPFLTQASMWYRKHAQLSFLLLTSSTPPSVHWPHATALQLASISSPSPPFMFGSTHKFVAHLLSTPIAITFSHPALIAEFHCYILLSPLHICRPSLLLSISAVISTATRKVQNRGHQIGATMDQGSAGNYNKARGNNSQMEFNPIEKAARNDSCPACKGNKVMIH